MFPVIQERTKSLAVPTQASHQPEEPDSLTTDGYIHQSEVPGEVGGTGDAQAERVSRATLRVGVLKDKHNYK